METIQFAYIMNDYHVLVTYNRDIEFVDSEYNKPIDDLITLSKVVNPNKEMLKFILQSRGYSIRNGLLDIFRGIITQLPADCAVFSSERAKFRTLTTNIYKLNDTSSRTIKIEELIVKLWDKYSKLSDDELFDLIYESIYKIARDIPIELFAESTSLPI